MATYQSIFNVEGKLGDYVFYKLNGKTVVRRKAQKKKGKKSTAQKNNEKKNSEFAEVMKSGKYFRIAMGEDYQHVGDVFLYQRMNSLFLSIKNCDPAEEGSRTIAGGLATAKGKKLLSKFRFPKKKSYPQISWGSKQGNALCFELNKPFKTSFCLTELQIDFSRGKFRKHNHSVSPTDEMGNFCIQKYFRKKKGYTELYLLQEHFPLMILCGE